MTSGWRAGKLDGRGSHSPIRKGSSIMSINRPSPTIARRQPPSRSSSRLRLTAVWLVILLGCFLFGMLIVAPLVSYATGELKENRPAPSPQPRPQVRPSASTQVVPIRRSVFPQSRRAAGADIRVRAEERAPIQNPESTEEAGGAEGIHTNGADSNVGPVTSSPPFTPPAPTGGLRVEPNSQPSPQ